MHKKGADGNPSDHVWTAILGWLDIFLSVKQSIDQQDLQANFPSQMCFVININNQVIEWLIIQKQHLLAVLLSRNTPPPPGQWSLQRLAWFIVATLLHSHQTHKHTLTNKHTELRYWTSVSLLSKGNMSALSSRSEVTSPCCRRAISLQLLLSICWSVSVALLASQHSISNIFLSLHKVLLAFPSQVCSYIPLATRTNNTSTAYEVR